jgi:hypothetical protein
MLLRCSLGLPIFQAVWVAPGCSGADPSASHRLCRNTLPFACFASGWRVAGGKMGWLNRELVVVIQQPRNRTPGIAVGMLL